MSTDIVTTWVKVKALIESDLQSARDRLEKPSLSFEDTLVTRGEIRALKRLLDPVTHQQDQNVSPD